MISLRDLKQITMADVRGKSSEEEREWLESGEIVVLWYHTLATASSDVTQQITTRRARINALKAPNGTSESTEYIAAKREYDQWRSKALFLVSRIDARKEHAQLLIRVLGLDIDRRAAVDTFERIINIIETHETRPDQSVKFIQRMVKLQLEQYYREAAPR